VKYDEKDGFYGSTHLVRKLFEQKQLRQIQAAVVLDMVADKRLLLTIPDTDRRGTPLLQHVFAAASSLGLARLRRTDGPLDVRRSHALRLERRAGD